MHIILGARLGGEEGEPELAQPRELLPGQELHPRVLEQLDELHLRRRELLGGDGAAGVDQVGGTVGRRGAVDLDAVDAVEGVVGIGDVDLEILDEGLQTVASYNFV